MLKRLLLFFLCLPLLLHARKVLVRHHGVPEQEGPWLTGPLLTGSGHVLPMGHANYEPTIYWGDENGAYNKHWNYHRTHPSFKSVLTQASMQWGILPKVELDFSPQFLYNYSGGQHMWRIPDQPLALGFQLLMDEPDTWWPAIKFRLACLIPLGKYDRLDPKKLFTDFAGGGDWAPTIGFVTVKTYHLGGDHWFSWRSSYNYTITVPVSVHGLNLYGGFPSIDGIKGTRGTVYPGCVLILLQGFEYSITHNWALALDLAYTHVNRTRFSGHSPKGTKPVLPSAESFSMAPALEYNFNANIGVIAGPWFTIAGRNDNLTDGFITWVFAVNIYH